MSAYIYYSLLLQWAIIEMVVLMLEFTVMDIKKQINSMIYLNVMSYSVLSGCGSCSIPSRKDIEELEPLFQALPADKRPYNICFSDSLYKKCLPQYEETIDNPYNFSSFRWTSRKRKKIIDVEVMANSIIACCNLIERILTFDLQLENRNFIIYLLHKTALNQARFIKKYLKVGNVFYNGEDVAAEDSNELHIQISSDDPDRVSQFAVFHAFAALIQMSNYDLYFFNYPIEELLEDINVIPIALTDISENVEKCSSKELSLIGLHIAEVYKKCEYFTDECNKALKKIARVLCQRVTDTGEVLRRDDKEEIASPSTSANTLNLLSELCYMFSSKGCCDASHKIYKNFCTNWDNESSVFKLKDSNKQRYSIKDIASIVSALFSFTRVIHEIDSRDELYNKLLKFSETVIIKSGIFNEQSYPILQQQKLELHTALEHEKLWAPVFNKNFEFKISKKKYYIDADVFRADHVLPACAMLLDSVNN